VTWPGDDVPVKTREPFDSIWRQLSRAEQREIVFTAIRGRAAADPFKSWLVVEFVTRSMLSPARWILAAVLLATQAVAVTYVWIRSHRIHWLGLVLFSLAALAIVIGTVTQLHARRVNQRLVDSDVSTVV
jgi:hypothetical protein